MGCIGSGLGAAGAWDVLRERVPKLGGACGAHNEGIWWGYLLLSAGYLSDVDDIDDFDFFKAESSVDRLV